MATKTTSNRRARDDLLKEHELDYAKSRLNRFVPKLAESCLVPTFASFRSGDPGRTRLRFMKAKQFDRKFEGGSSIVGDLDSTQSTRPKLAQKRVNVDFPKWMIDRLDKEARRLGVTRQSVIKVWLSERLEQQLPNQAS